MTDPAVDQFRALLTRRFGWRLDDDRGQLAQALTSRLGPHQSAREYVTALEHASPWSAEVREIAETLAVSETYFFRNPEQYAVLAERAIPTVAARRADGPLRLLSAGSASGEEAYSIAMTVLQLRKRAPLPPVEILGIDVSRRAVEKARRGRYSAWALRGLPDPLRREYFDHDGRHFDIRREVASMVQFEERNLLDLQTAAPGPWDIVFFRNTSMYFTVDVARRIVEQLAAAMPPGGFLFLGHAETLRGISEAFDLEQVHQTFCYVRRPADRPHVEPTAVSSHLPAPSVMPPEPSVADNDEWFHEITRATERVAALVDSRDRMHASGPEPPARDAAPDALASALALLAEERHEAALAALGDASDTAALTLRAVLLANMGRMPEAREVCDAMLAIDNLHAGAHYIHALCNERAGLEAEAVQRDEMAIYVDDTFAMPHLHLALMARKRGDRAAALRHARLARALFADEDDLRILLFGGGFTRHALMQLCDAQLQALPS